MLTSKDFDRVYRGIEDLYESIAGWDPVHLRILKNFKGDLDHWFKAAEYLEKALTELEKIEEFQ